ncbi:hypothetical protein HDU77_001391, partial [Chytriomyces hyalinus]
MASYAMNPYHNNVTLESLRDAIAQVKAAADHLTGDQYSEFKHILRDVHDDIHFEESKSLLVSLWVSKVSHVLGFPPINPLAAALDQSRQESLRAYYKLRANETPKAPRSIAGQKRPSSSTQLNTQRKSSTPKN